MFGEVLDLADLERELEEIADEPEYNHKNLTEAMMIPNAPVGFIEEQETRMMQNDGYVYDDEENDRVMIASWNEKNVLFNF